MKLAVLNPNTTRAMTDAVLAEVRLYTAASDEINGMTAREGCAVIDSRASFAIGAETAMRMLADVAPGTGAIVLACFGDPGLQALRDAVRIPVIGLAEAAILQAHRLGQRFAIITAGAAWVEMLQERVHDCNASHLLAGVYALAGNGAALQRDPEAFRAQVLQLSVQAADAGAVWLVLGGAAFAGLDFAVDARLQLLNPVEAAIQAAKTAAQPS